MNYRFLLYSCLFFIGAFIYYKFNKWSLEDRDGIKNPELYSKSQTKLQKFNSWVIIGCLLIAALVNFFKAILKN